MKLLDHTLSYEVAAASIEAQVNAGTLSPVLASGKNGKVPPLYNRYIQNRKKEEHPEWKRELQVKLVPPLDPSWYLEHLAQYGKDREGILKLNNFFLDENVTTRLQGPASLNERSFEIFQDEKYLEKNSRILKHLGLTLEYMNIYLTHEPSIYFQVPGCESGQVLVVENLDSYITLRRLMSKGLADCRFQAVVYGCGGKVSSTFQDFLDQQEKPVSVLYWGDLDWEGIRIFDSFQTRYPQISIQLFSQAYQAMMEKGRQIALPTVRSAQRTMDEEYLPEEQRALLESFWYIPQEILQSEDLVPLVTKVKP